MRSDSTVSHGSKNVAGALRTVVASFFGAFLALTALVLIPAVLELAQSLSRGGIAEASVGALAFLLTPSIAALTIPLALLLGLSIGMGWSTSESVSIRRSPGLSRVVTAFVLPVCLVEVALLAGVVPAANQEFRRALFVEMSDGGAAIDAPPKGVREMTLTELRGVAASSERGTDMSQRSASFELHKRLSIPIAGLFLAFLGMALGLSQRSKRSLWNLTLACTAGVLWCGLLELGASMAPTARVPSWWGAWFPAFAACLLAVLAWWRYGARHLDV